MTLTEYIDCLSHLPVNKNNGCVAPHKAILLLSVFHLISIGEIDSPFIPITESLEKTFALTWNRYVKSSANFSCALNYPFHHLSSSPFWSLVKLPNYRFQKEYSLSALKKNFAGALIDETLFQLIKEENARVKIENVLINTYLRTEYSPQSSTNAILSAMVILLLTVA